MRSFSRWVFTLCASPVGVFVLAAPDSTLFFSLRPQHLLRHACDRPADPLRLESALAFRCRRRIIVWIDSDLFHDVVALFMFTAFALTALSLFRLMRSTRSPEHRAGCLNSVKIPAESAHALIT